MSKTTKTQDAAFSYMDDFNRAFEGAGLEVPEAARDFLRKQAADAAGKAETLHRQALNAAASGQKIAGSLGEGYMTFTRGLMDATVANARHYFDTLGKIADARSPGDVVKLQADYVRESATANFDRLRGAANETRAFVAERVRTVQAEIEKTVEEARKAA